MSKNIVVVQPDDDAVETSGPIRTLANKSNGSDRISFVHEITSEADEVKGVVYNGHDELVYIIQGKSEIVFDGKTEIAGPGTFFFVPDGASYDFKVIETPFDVVAAFSPPLPSGHFD